MRLPFNLSLRRSRNAAVLAYDGLAAGLSFLLALNMRWAEQMWIHAASYWLHGAILCTIIMTLFIIATRFYRRLWRYVSIKDITDLMKLAVATLGLFYVLLFFTTRLEMMPRSVPVIHALALLALLCAPRFLYRAAQERRLQLPTHQQIPVLLVGAGPEAEAFIRESRRSLAFPYRPVGLVARESGITGRLLQGVRVYGELHALGHIVHKLNSKGLAPQRVILTDPHLDGAEISDVLNYTQSQNIPLARIPRLTDLQGGEMTLQIKPIDVADILGRPQTAPDCAKMRRIVAGKVVMVTGAGGSIGAELVRQLAGFNPERLVLLDHGEYNLYMIDRELQEMAGELPRHARLADIRDEKALAQIFKEEMPQVVFHTAALKHVPLCETNPEEAVLTNVIGTQHVADCCAKSGVELMVLISTDKAVNPSNVMGACKRLAESYCQALGQSGAKTRFITVRFGNVLGSTGSVVPLFEHQLRRGGPLTVTHKDMTRYFMTIGEAVQLVILSAALGMEQNDQPAPIFVLDMGEPVRIDDLALQMIRLAGLRPHQDIEIVYTGLRPGEKLHEELFYDCEPTLTTPHNSIHLARARDMALKPLRKKMDQLYEAALLRQGDKGLALLAELVPEYQRVSEPVKEKPFMSILGAI